MREYVDTLLPICESSMSQKHRDDSKIDTFLIAIETLENQVQMIDAYMKEIRDKIIKQNICYSLNSNGCIYMDSKYSDEIQKYILQYNDNVKTKNKLVYAIEEIRMFSEFEMLPMKSMADEHDTDYKGVQILCAQEKERSRIACELHDSIIQRLVNLLHTTELCMHTIDRDTIAVKLDLQFMMQEIKFNIQEIRSIIYNLKPMSLEDLGLDSAIKRFFAELESLYPVQVTYNNDVQQKVFDGPIVSLTVFRIIQEACHNSCRHGHASHILVQIFEKSSFMMLRIIDNGCGFDVKARIKYNINDYSGYGLSIMKERVHLLSGNFEIESTKERGTQIVVKIPSSLCWEGSNGNQDSYSR